MCGPDGFLDSARYQHSYKVRMEKKDKPSKSAETSSDGSGSRPRSRSGMTVVDVYNQVDRGQKSYEKRIKVIEVHYLLILLCIHPSLYPPIAMLYTSVNRLIYIIIYTVF